ATEHLDMWEQLIGSRKNPLKQASIIGFGTLFSLFARQLTLEDAVARVSKRIGIKGRAIVWPYAEPCMDVDKPHQLELLRADLEMAQARSAAKAKRNLKKTASRAKVTANSKKKSSAAEKVPPLKAARTRPKPKARPKLQE